MMSTNEGNPQLQIVPRFTFDYLEMKMTSDMYQVATDIFEREYRTALENHERIRQEVLQDEDDGAGYFEESFENGTIHAKSGSISKRRVFSTQKRKTRVPGDAAVHTKIQPPADHGSDTDIFGESK
jgi:hypothetical protein